MIRIPADIRAKMTVLAGDPAQVSNAPAPVFDPLRLDFLADLSRALLAHPVARTMPDVVSFAYWTRRANLTQLGVAQLTTDDRMSGVVRLGLGLSFHICPSNVPVNFAFSLAFGLLSGNTCVLRLPSKTSETAERIVDAVTTLLAQDKYASFVDAIVLARFERDDDVNRFWLGVADARVVWGGDATVAHMRSLPCRPRSREVAFSDRYSLCAIAPEAVLELDDADLRALCAQLYNDLYLMDQAACSSPQLLAWIGERDAVAAAQTRLWSELVAHARTRYVPRAVQVIDKYVDACRHAVGNEQVVAIEQHGNLLYRIALSNVTPDQDSRRGYFGTIHEVTLASLTELAPIVNERYQTLTYFGIEQAQLHAFVIDARPRGVDRVVPVGRALDMNIVWDGYDIVASLSRVIDLR
ncbi:acyl-CoA reductase [Paraburkholderia hospita]|uniref:acyl-CoA reductase n=1 Tax=Paraburkholderia hospita TaxID=169430 RepID=UPI000271CEE7|nr:acyl-CoA reductase [Paraburkholderia hospita]EUC21281.1 acyl-CoA reductase [Burkholderia sp. BT03]SKC94879.1 Acyl-CoA reductase (LuxC) [Paraburkholderia hospita]